jgi:UDP-N-acetylmuramate: L-alanyl-gamma-D-glutamyl-meso-diaminopimelate ligase
MHIHILGICGKFMSGLAIIAKQMGFRVSGSDQNLLPGIIERLRFYDIVVKEGYSPATLEPAPDCVVIGNALSRGQPVIESILNRGISYYSGPQWLAEQVLSKRWVLAVSGTHGKTTTTSMLAWILEFADLNPGFLIGGNPHNFHDSARFTDSNFFVIEADEYDTAFFDKQSKFLHYYPRTLIINNLEFDHADIFKDLEAIKLQFQYLLRLVPGHGLIVVPEKDQNIHDVLDKGCWSPISTFGDIGGSAIWAASPLNQQASLFDVFYKKAHVGTVSWELIGQHNLANGLAAIAAAHHVGVLPLQAIAALNQFQGVKQRLELKGTAQGVSVYEDFAHHPTAIAMTLAGLRRRIEKQRIFAVVEFGSHTMRIGYHQQSMLMAFTDADNVVFLRPKNNSWDIDGLATHLPQPVIVFDDEEQIISHLQAVCQTGDHVLFMSNLGFSGIHHKLLQALNGNSH